MIMALISLIATIGFIRYLNNNKFNPYIPVVNKKEIDLSIVKNISQKMTIDYLYEHYDSVHQTITVTDKNTSETTVSSIYASKDKICVMKPESDFIANSDGVGYHYHDKDKNKYGIYALHNDDNALKNILNNYKELFTPIGVNKNEIILSAKAVDDEFIIKTHIVETKDNFGISYTYIADNTGVLKRVEASYYENKDVKYTDVTKITYNNDFPDEYYKCLSYIKLEKDVNVKVCSVDKGKVKETFDISHPTNVEITVLYPEKYSIVTYYSDIELKNRVDDINTYNGDTLYIKYMK